jgi:hypothetical protein
MNVNEMMTELPCLCSCTHWRADRLRQILGMFYLRSLTGPVEPPPLAEVLRGCCRNGEVLSVGQIDPHSTTFILPQKHARVT